MKQNREEAKGDERRNGESTPRAKRSEHAGAIARRSFLEGAAVVGVLAVLGGTAVAWGDDGSRMRPPGAVNEETFVGLCLRCDKCRSACPENAIALSKIEDGLVEARTPIMDFRRGYCTECDGEYRCIKACPTGALTAFDPSSDRIGLAAIQKDCCLTYTLAAKCSYKCIDVCPADALYRDDEGLLRLNDDVCWGCGACENVCPANSYGAYSGSRLRGINVWAMESGGVR